jgi:Flp pilus assembly protein TadG
LKSYECERDGAILPYVAIMLIAIIGPAGLAINGNRLMSAQTRLQNAADALALARAAELDRGQTIRARAASDNLIANLVVGAGTDQVAQVSNIEFLQSLPASEDLHRRQSDLFATHGIVLWQQHPSARGTLAQ